MPRGIKHITNVERRLAQRQLDDRRPIGQSRDAAIQHAAGFRVERFGERCKPRLLVFCRSVIDRQRDGTGFEHDKCGGNPDRRSPSRRCQVRRRTARERGEAERDDHGKAGRGPQAVEARYVVVEHGIQVRVCHEPAPGANLGAE